MSMNIASGRCKFWNFTNSAIGMSVRQENFFAHAFVTFLSMLKSFAAGLDLPFDLEDCFLGGIGIETMS